MERINTDYKRWTQAKPYKMRKPWKFSFLKPDVQYGISGSIAKSMTQAEVQSQAEQKLLYFMSSEKALF